MKKHILMLSLGWLALAAGCADDAPPPSVEEFLENRILLDAVMVRCNQNRSEMKYDAQCVNARDAANTIARRQEVSKRSTLEQQSESKRAALRRTQAAAEQARKRAAEAEALRKEAEYVSQFGGEISSATTDSETSQPTPPGVSFEPANDSGAADNTGGNIGDVAAIPSANKTSAAIVAETSEETAAAHEVVVDSTLVSESSEQDLQSVREELQRRQEAQPERR